MEKERNENPNLSQNRQILHRLLKDKMLATVEILLKNWHNYTQEERNDIVYQMCESYFKVLEELPEPCILDLMTEFILSEVNSDKHPDKMSREEYPIMTIHQFNRRKKRNNLIGSEIVLDFLNSKYRKGLSSLYKSTHTKSDTPL